MRGPFIVTITRESMQKQLYFSGPDRADAEEQFQSARKSFDVVAERCTSWDAFYAAAISHFASFGFMRIAK